MRVLYWLCALLFIFSAGCAPIAAPTPSAQTPSTAQTPTAPAQPSPTTLVFRDVALFDGETLHPTATVVVRDGLIAEVYTDENTDAALPTDSEAIEDAADVEVIDGAGMTLLPGLIDAHVHTFSEDALRQQLIFGVTTQLDMFMDSQLASYLRQEQAATGAVQRADLFSAGTLATAPGGHGTQFGLEIETLTSADQAQAFVEARVAEGSDYIKIIIEDGAWLGLDLPTLNQATVDALVQAAHARDKLAVVHVQTLAAAQMALEAGADGLAHTFADALPDQAFIDRAVAANLFVIPTLTVLQGYGSQQPNRPLIEDPHLAPYLTAADIQSLMNPYQGDALSITTAQEVVHQLFDAGVPILAGTDAQNPGTTYGASLHRELLLLTQSGLSPLEALAAATSVTADVFSLDDRGRIAPGLRADLLLVNGDPTAEITATRDIVGVWKLGVQADRAGYLQAIQAQQAEATAQQEAFVQADTVTISDFESQTISTTFGVGWEASTDQPAGGASTVEMELVADGADGTGYSLLLTGELSDAVPFAWAGALFMPGTPAYSPFDLSSKPILHFWAKGEGGPHRVQVNCQNLGQVFAEQTFDVTAEWQAYSFDLASFDNCDTAGVRAIVISAGAAPSSLPAPFSFQIDEVSLRP